MTKKIILNIVKYLVILLVATIIAFIFFLKTAQNNNQQYLFNIFKLKCYYNKPQLSENNLFIFPIYIPTSKCNSKKAEYNTSLHIINNQKKVELYIDSVSKEYLLEKYNLSSTTPHSFFYIIHDKDTLTKLYYDKNIEHIFDNSWAYLL